MRRKRDRIFIQIPRVTLLDVQVRLKKNDLKNDEEYAVLKVCFVDTFDDHALSWKSKKTAKNFTVMCFRDEIWRRLIATHVFSFEGFVSLKYGGVYFVAEKAYDELDFNIEKEESLYFTNYKPLTIGEAMELFRRSPHLDEEGSQHT